MPEETNDQTVETTEAPDATVYNSLAEIENALKDETKGISFSEPEVDDDDVDGVEAEPVTDDDDSDDAEEQPEKKADYSLVDRAVKLGMSASKALTMSPEALAATIEVLEERQPASEEKPAEKKAEEPDDYKPVAFPLSLLEQFDEDTQKDFKSFEDEINSRLKAALALKQELAMARSEATTTRIDSWFNQNEVDLFGEGTVEDVDPKSEHFANRQKLLKAASEILAVSSKDGKAMRLEKAMERALKIEFADRKVEKRNNQTRSNRTERPTQRKADTPLTQGRPTEQEIKREMQQALKGMSFD